MRIPGGPERFLKVTDAMKKDTWNSGEPYEYFMGRWSTRMAPVFLQWLNAPQNKSWLDVGCGTGALSESIYQHGHPSHLCCIDPSAGFLEKAREKGTFKADFRTAGASAIPFAENSFDIVVSGLALNFFPDLPGALAEIQRVLKKEGILAAYVWDYAGKMEILRQFWDAACELDKHATILDEGNRFPVCHPDKLKPAFEQAGLTNIETSFLDIQAVFKDFDDYWNPFLGGQGPAPGYLASLSERSRENIKHFLQKKLPVNPDGTIPLLARAIAIRGNNKK